MTFGQRVAQKRKELGLSQEGLGERLGVSRQAIYKWEADAAMPEIDKLITLSKIFSVPVGWLLGVEETASETAGQDREQLVEDILSRYQAAQPDPRKSVWDQWSVRFLFAMCGIMIALLVGTSSKIREMEQAYVYLRSDMNSQISSITSRLRAALEDQDEPLLEWNVNHEIDLKTNTVTFQVQAVLKEYTEGMELRLAAQSGGEVVEAPIPLDPGLPLTGQVTCPLSDDISLYMVLSSDGVQRPRYLGNYMSLYSENLPNLVVIETLAPVNGVIPANGTYLQVRKDGELIQDPSILQVGLFQDRKLLLWYQGGIETTSWNGTPTEEYIWRRPQDVTLEPGHQYCEAAVYTDEYGRQRVYPGEVRVYDELSGNWLPSTPWVDGLTDWEF